jgi:hypothetical protein
MCDEDFIDLRCFLRCFPLAPRHQRSILYAGRDHALAQALSDELQASDCMVSYCPAGWLARVFLKSDAAYALCVFDEQQQPEGTGAELVAFARAPRHRERTPCLIFKPADSRKRLAETNRRLLAKPESPPR